jgi:hypothetical protein
LKGENPFARELRHIASLCVSDLNLKRSSSAGRRFGAQSPIILNAGRYWVSVQANMSSTNGQWGWTDRTVQANSPAVWQNPGGQFNSCLTWGVRTTCVGDAAAPDQMFRLVGAISGGTPTPAPTGTPSPAATATPTPTSTACRPTPGCISYEAESDNNTLEGSAIVLSCPTCSGGFKVGYVGSNDGTLQFNNVGAIASGNYTVTICYLNGDAVRYAYLSVNGGPGTPVSFPSTGSFHTVGSIQRTVTLNTGCNTLKFYNPIVGSWSPDFDSIRFNCPTCTESTPTPTPTPTATPASTPTPTPAVTTNPTTNVASFSATLNGSLNPRGATTTVYFEYGTTTSYGSTTAMQTQTGNAVRAITANISGLTANTTCHFRIVAHNGGGTSFGSDRTFTTLSATGAPVSITNPASLIASLSATLNGMVDPHGLSTTVHFEYGTTTNYGLSSSPQTKTGNTYQNVAAGISGLSASATYHFRIVATNSAGTTYGADQIFTTLSATGPPVVTTNPATNVASHSATLNSTVDPHGLSTSVHFQYGTSTSYGSNTASQNLSGNTYQNASANVTGLSGSTTYHFRIVATNSAGTTHGSDKTFTTP